MSHDSSTIDNESQLLSSTLDNGQNNQIRKKSQYARVFSKMIEGNVNTRLPSISREQKQKQAPQSTRVQSPTTIDTLNLNRKLVEYFLVVSSIPRKSEVSGCSSPSPPRSPSPSRSILEEKHLRRHNCSDSPTESNVSYNDSGSIHTPSTASDTDNTSLRLNSNKGRRRRKYLKKLKSTFKPSPSDHCRERKRRDYGNIILDNEDEHIGAHSNL